jgi:hypothetical protein
MLAILWPFLIYWLVFFVACYTVVEVGQDQFYDEVTPMVGWKVAGGSFVLAALATWIRPSYESIFTSDIAWTALQAIVWVLVFIFVFQFHPWHALAIALVTMVLVSGLATLGVDSLTKPSVTVAPVQTSGSQPVRKPIGAIGAPPPATSKDVPGK